MFYGCHRLELVLEDLLELGEVIKHTVVVILSSKREW